MIIGDDAFLFVTRLNRARNDTKGRLLLYMEASSFGRSLRLRPEDQYVIFDGVRVAKVSGGGAVTYFHTDHLGSHHVTTNSSGTQTLVTNYLPFGEFEGTPPTGTEGPNYTGQHYDAETGLYYYGARYYNPKIGRFLNADWIVQSPFNSQSYNRFSYVANNPINLIDPSGNNYINQQGSQVYMQMDIYRQGPYQLSDLALSNISSNGLNPGYVQWQFLSYTAQSVINGSKTFIAGSPQNFDATLARYNESTIGRLNNAFLTAYTAVEGGVGLAQLGKAAVAGFARSGPLKILGNEIGSVGGQEGIRQSLQQTTVIGSRSDTLKFLGKKGYNVLNLKNWSSKKNLQWLDDAIKNGDKIMLATDPLKHQSLMQKLNKASAFLDLEMPYLLENGLIQKGRYMIR